MQRLSYIHCALCLYRLPFHDTALYPEASFPLHLQYEPDHPAIEFLKLKSFTCSQKIDDKLFLDKDFSKKIAQKLITIKPLNEFLNRALETED